MKDRRVRKRGRRAEDQETRLSEVPHMPAPHFEVVSGTYEGHTVQIPFHGEAGRRAAEKVAAEFERSGALPGC